MYIALDNGYNWQYTGHMKTTKSAYTGTRLFEILAAQGRRQDWLAEQIGCSQSLVSKIKYGQRPIPVWFAERAAAVMGLPENVLFFGPDVTERSDLLPERNFERVA